MSAQQLVALAIFSLVSAITPGPNNFFVLNCSVVFGWRRALPAWCGVCVGFFLMLVAVGAGLRELFIAYPVAYTVLKIVSVCYLLYLSWRVATADTTGPDDNPRDARPITFSQMVLFQWVNPKAWAMGLTAFAVYAPASVSFPIVLLVASIFAIICIPSVGVWVLLGMPIRRIINEPKKLRAFNFTMAALLVASMYPILFD